MEATKKEASSHSVHAEQSVLGGLMLDNKAWHIITAQLTERDFFRKDHQLIFRAISRLAERQEPFDVVTLSEIMEQAGDLAAINGGLAYLAILARDTPSAANISSYAKIVHDHSIERQIAAAAARNDKTALKRLLDLQENQSKPAERNVFIDDLDSDENLTNIKLIDFLPDDHILKRISKQAAKAYHLPESTVAMMGLAIYSSMTCRKYVVNYPDNINSLPLGLYVLAEQPPGVGKTRCMNLFQSPFFEIHKDSDKKRKRRLAELLSHKELKGELDQDERDELFDLQNSNLSMFFTTNATSEGVESVMPDTKGFFSCQSSEQGLTNTLFGKTYSSGAANNDVTLNGFDGAYVNFKRGGRSGYVGQSVGSIVCFAQDGTIKTVLEVSNGTGLAERFLMIEEPHLLGYRDHLEFNSVSQSLIDEYRFICQFAADLFDRPLEYDCLSRLMISDAGFEMIAKYKNKIEPELRDFGKYSYPALRGYASKINMQIMKIAANLHLMNNGFFYSVISDEFVLIAIKICNQLLKAQLKMLRDKGFIGIKAEYTAILDYFTEGRAEGSERDIYQNKRYTKPFSEMKGAIAVIKKNLVEMVAAGLLATRVDMSTGKPKTFYFLAQ